MAEEGFQPDLTNAKGFSINHDPNVYGLKRLFLHCPVLNLIFTALKGRSHSKYMLLVYTHTGLFEKSNSDPLLRV